MSNHRLLSLALATLVSASLACAPESSDDFGDGDTDDAIRKPSTLVLTGKYRSTEPVLDQFKYLEFEPLDSRTGVGEFSAVLHGEPTITVAGDYQLYSSRGKDRLLLEILTGDDDLIIKDGEPALGFTVSLEGANLSIAPDGGSPIQLSRCTACSVDDFTRLFGIQIGKVAVSVLNNNSSWDSFSGQPDLRVCLNDDDLCTPILCDDKRSCAEPQFIIGDDGDIFLVDEFIIQGSTLSVYDDDGVYDDLAGTVWLSEVLTEEAWAFGLEGLRSVGDSLTVTVDPFDIDGLGADVTAMDNDPYNAGVKAFEFEVVLLQDGILARP